MVRRIRFLRPVWTIAHGATPATNGRLVFLRGDVVEVRPLDARRHEFLRADGAARFCVPDASCYEFLEGE